MSEYDPTMSGADRLVRAIARGETNARVGDDEVRSIAREEIEAAFAALADLTIYGR